jgi:hypothetical protein
MKIFSAVTKGAVKSAESYSLVITAWLITFIMVWSSSLMLRASFNSMLGDSMISESLLGGFDISLIGDMSGKIAPFMTSLMLTTMFLIIIGSLMNVFFAGGFFGRFTDETRGLKISDFFRASARYFFPYLGIGVVVGLMILLWIFLLIGLPLILTSAATRGTSQMSILIKIMGVIALLGLPVLLLVADNARTWMARTDKRKMFKAIGEGFKTTFRGFLKNYISVFIVMIVSILLTLLIIYLFKNSIPEKGIMIFLFFLLTQAIAIIKVWIRSWRYATVAGLAAERAQL